MLCMQYFLPDTSLYNLVISQSKSAELFSLAAVNFSRLSVSDNMIQSVCWPQVPCLPTLTFLGIYGNQVGTGQFLA